MGSGKEETSSETNSSDENDDRQEQVKLEDNTTAGNTTKRSYGCTFCKRGFTNAQALGGHMNIHRKDRAKTKQLTPAGSSFTSSPRPSQLEYNNMNPNFTGRVSGQGPMNYYPVFSQPPCPSHHQQQENGIQFLGNQSNEQLWGEILSLGVGSNHNFEVNTNEDELDLELRLGHDR